MEVSSRRCRNTKPPCWRTSKFSSRALPRSCSATPSAGPSRMAIILQLIKLQPMRRSTSTACRKLSRQPWRAPFSKPNEAHPDNAQVSAARISFVPPTRQHPNTVSMQISLSPKIAIITGAASGIGLATALRYLEAGVAGIVAVDIAPQIPAAFSEPIAAGRLVYVNGDVSRQETAERFTREALEHFARIDVLVNNAGISVVKPLHEHSPDEWDAVMN